MAKATVLLPDYNFVNQTNNTINVRTANPNGQQDDQTSNDNYAVDFKPSLQITNNAKVEVRPLTNPSKLTWELKASNGSVVASGGPYTTPLAAQTTDVTLDADECYTLNFKNTATSFNGTLKLIDSEGKEKLKLDADPNLNSNTVVGTNLALSVDNVINTAALLIYPNPVSGQFQVELEMKKSSDVSFQVYNMLGQLVKNQVANLTTGAHQQSINVSQLQKGMYILKIQTQEGSISKTFVKE
ncbi:MAG: T9SS type A sorting domain-containing protein [Saprospiraceae bacterium]